MQERFLAAVQAEEAGEKQRAIKLYEEIMEIDPQYAAAYINLGTILFHLRQYGRPRSFTGEATEADPAYVLAFFDLGNVLDELQRTDESIAAYRRRLRWRPATPTHTIIWPWPTSERASGARRCATGRLIVRLDNRGPWADHARGQIRKLIGREKLPLRRARRALSRPAKGRRRWSWCKTTYCHLPSGQ